jgi:hypothetical protein
VCATNPTIALVLNFTSCSQLSFCPPKWRKRRPEQQSIWPACWQAGATLQTGQGSHTKGPYRRETTMDSVGLRSGQGRARAAIRWASERAELRGGEVILHARLGGREPTSSPTRPAEFEPTSATSNTAGCGKHGCCGTVHRGCWQQASQPDRHMPAAEFADYNEGGV